MRFTPLNTAHFAGALVVLASLVTPHSLSAAAPLDAGAATKTVPVTLASATTTLRVGGTTTVRATQGSSAVTGNWSVLGGTAFGTITSSGQYTAPASLPLISYAVVYFTSGSGSAELLLQLQNPLPVVSGASVQSLSAAATPVVISGTGFVAKSQILMNGTAVATTFVDSSHVSAKITVPASATKAVSLQVSNPSPGGATSAALSIPLQQQQPAMAVSPSSLAVGQTSITVSYPGGVPANAAVAVDGTTWTKTGSTATTITASGYVAPWKTGSVSVSLLSGSTQMAQAATPIAATAVPFDTAARFATQAGFGPRMDVVQHIQAIGLSAYIDEQEATAADPYNVNEGSRSHFLRGVLNANDLLRKRMGWAFEIMIPQPGNATSAGLMPWEVTVEAHAFGSYRQILEDALSNPSIASFLSLPNNFASSDPTVHANQNFGRELMQLMSIGLNQLNEDGTTVNNANGTPIATYGQSDVNDASRALTGWTTPTPVNAAFTNYGVDWSLPLVSVESGHDHGSKTVLGVTFPAGQTAVQDREQLIDVLFNSPNLPPFVSRQLIQRLVKSAPSAAYVSRVVQVFKNDGNGVRGNLGAVIKAILLDPEARAGDTAVDTTAGFVQDPLYQQIAAMSLLGINAFDDQPSYDPAQFGLNWWISPSIFSYFSPSYVIPGTSTNSPEFQLIDTVTILQRSQFMWGVVSGTATGIPQPSSQLFTQFPNLTSMMDAMNHILYHGSMPQATRDAITAYCSSISDPTLQLQSAVFLSINSDNHNVVQ